MYQRLYTYVLSEGIIFSYQLPNHRINKNQQWHLKAALYVWYLNTITINVMYKSIRSPAPIVMKLTILTDPSLVPIALYLICLLHALVSTRSWEEILHVHYMTTPQHKKPCPGGMNYIILADSSLDIITIPSVCLICACGGREVDF